MQVNPLYGSLRGYITYTPRKVKDEYVEFEFDSLENLKALHSGIEPNENFYTIDSISIYFGNKAYNI